MIKYTCSLEKINRFIFIAMQHCHVGTKKSSHGFFSKADFIEILPALVAGVVLLFLFNGATLVFIDAG